MIVEEILFPAYKIGTGSWTDDNAESILRTTSGTPSCESTGLEWIEDEGDDDEVGFRLDSPDSYAFNFNEFEIHAFICGTDLYTETQFQLKIGGETFTLNTQNTGVSQWYSDTFTSPTTFSSSELNFAQLWITADGRNHRDTKIPTIFVIATGEYDVEQWDPEGSIELGGCSGFRVLKSGGGVCVGGTNDLDNSILWKSTGGVCVGSPVKYGTGGVAVGGTSNLINATMGIGGIKVGGTNVLYVPWIASGGVCVGSSAFPNGFHYRATLTVPAATAIQEGTESRDQYMGILLGTPVYVPYLFGTYRLENEQGEPIPIEIVSETDTTQGATNNRTVKISLFFRMNITGEDQTLYLYGKGRAE